MSTIAEIAEAVKDAINAAANSQFVVTAQRVYAPITDYSGLSESTPTVLVYPPRATRTNEARGTLKSEIEIHIWYGQKLAGNTQPQSQTATAAIDELMDFAETLSEVIEPGQMYADVPCVRTEHEPLYDFSLLRERVFAGVGRAFFTRWTDH